MDLDSVASFVGFTMDMVELPEVEDFRGTARALVDEADQIKSSTCSLDDPWGFDSQVCAEVIPRYLVAVALLDAHLESGADDIQDAFSQKAGYVQDVGLLLMGSIIAYRRRGRKHRDLDGDDLVRARKLRDLAIAVFTQIPEARRDAGTWYNLGSMLELAGRLDDAVMAFQQAARLDDGSNWSDMARESIQEIRAGNTTSFP